MPGIAGHAKQDEQEHAQRLEATRALHMTDHEAAMLRGMLREQLDNDLDMLEDLEHADELAGMAADRTIERVSFALRLEATLV